MLWYLTGISKGGKNIFQQCFLFPYYPSAFFTAFTLFIIFFVQLGFSQFKFIILRKIKNWIGGDKIVDNFGYTKINKKEKLYLMNLSTKS